MSYILVVFAVTLQTISVLGDYEGVSVASLGDPDVATWIPAIAIRPPPVPSSDGPCGTVTNGLHARVLYAHVGPFDSPRATVLGVLVNYTTAPVGNFRPDDDDAAEDVVVPIRATVVFVDLTRPPIRTFAEPPTYEFRLPEDFYYPFWSSSTDNGGSGSGAAAASASVSSSRRNQVTFLPFVSLVTSYGSCFTAKALAFLLRRFF